MPIPEQHKPYAAVVGGQFFTVGCCQKNGQVHSRMKAEYKKPKRGDFKAVWRFTCEHCGIKINLCMQPVPKESKE